MSKALELALTTELMAKDTPILDAPEFVEDMWNVTNELRRLAEIERKYNELYFFNELSVRAKNCLAFEGIKTLDDVKSKTYQLELANQKK